MTLEQLLARTRHEPTTGCRVWTGATTDGYGRVRVAVYAHRLALELHLGRPLGPGKLALHSCDRPSCVELTHLREGTQAENMREASERGRLPGTNRKLDREQVEWIRARYADGYGWWTRHRLARRFAVTEATISCAVRGLTWRDAGGPTSERRGPRGRPVAVAA